jgi:hypothetical protein
MNERALVLEVTRTDANRPRSAVEAYVNVYDNNCSRRTATNEVSKILAKDHIKAAIQEAEAKIELDRRRSRLGSMQAIETALWDIARNSDADSVKVSALRELRSMLPTDLDEEQNSDTAIEKHKLIERLDSILTANLNTNIIDITPSDEEDEDEESAILEIEAELMSTREPDF